MKNANSILENRIVKLECADDDRSQSLLESDLEICGVPSLPDENLQSIVSILASSLDITISEPSIVDVYRKTVKSDKSGLPAPIIVKFQRKSVKDEFMVKKKPNPLIHPAFPLQVINDQFTQMNV